MLCCELVLGLLKDFASFHGLYIGLTLARCLQFISAYLAHLYFGRQVSSILSLIATLFWLLASRFHTRLLTQYSPSTQNDPSCRSEIVNVPSLAVVSWCQTQLTDGEHSEAHAARIGE